MLPDIPHEPGLVIRLNDNDRFNFKTPASDEGIIRWMTDFHFYHLIEVRYGDLDPQGHVNNAKFLTYMEQGRVFYLKQLKLWDGGSFQDIGIILADVQITFRKAIQFGDPIRVGVRISKLGNKSMTSEYCIEDARDESVFATGSSVLVAYDYRNQRSLPIPEEWRNAIQQFEAIAEKV
jgi:acyl-CoA thioester hydrolase